MVKYKFWLKLISFVIIVITQLLWVVKTRIIIKFYLQLNYFYLKLRNVLLHEVLIYQIVTNSAEIAWDSTQLTKLAPQSIFRVVFLENRKVINRSIVDKGMNILVSFPTPGGTLNRVSRFRKISTPRFSYRPQNLTMYTLKMLSELIVAHVSMLCWLFVMLRIWIRYPREA